MNYSFPKLLETLIAGSDSGLVLATIVEVSGSTPQVPGASAVFSRDRLVTGTVGGGLLELRVEALARKTLEDGTARFVKFWLDADPSDPEGAVCGGTVKVLIDPAVGRDRTVFAAALEGLRKRRPGYLVTGIEGPEEIVKRTGRVWLSADDARSMDRDPSIPLSLERIDFAVRHPHLIEDEGWWWFVEPVRPLPRLIIAGAGHVGRAVARLGSLLDFNVAVIDDRAEFANKNNIPEADEFVVGPIGDSLTMIEDAADNYYVIVTRGHQKDGEALRALIGRRAAYIGMIGSKTKIEIMRREFLERELTTPKEWAGVHAPIGLDIGSKTVEEIAVSIAAELVLVRSRRNAEVLG